MAETLQRSPSTAVFAVQYVMVTRLGMKLTTITGVFGL